MTSAAMRVKRFLIGAHYLGRRSNYEHRPKHGPWPHPHLAEILADVASNVKSAALKQDLLGGAAKAYQTGSPFAG